MKQIGDDIKIVAHARSEVIGMFTGIVEELGTIANMQQSGEAMKLTIHANKILSDVHLGDSIAVNGICLTVTSFTTTSFTVDAMPETMQSTSLRNA